MVIWVDWRGNLRATLVRFSVVEAERTQVRLELDALRQELSCGALRRSPLVNYPLLDAIAAFGAPKAKLAPVSFGHPEVQESTGFLRLAPNRPCGEPFFVFGNP